jgi:SAM-dependent methyltransferase
VSRREKFLYALDRVGIRIATRKYLFLGPNIAYQNLPWSGITGARRAAGSAARLEAMLEALRDEEAYPRSVLDIGCNVGYFSLSLAQRGLIAFGVDMDRTALRVATISSRDLGENSGTFVPIEMNCTPESIPLLPDVDIVICLSVWHHWVRHSGLAIASENLTKLWSKTKTALFFDSGESEMPSIYNLPFGDESPAKWLEQYLGELLPSAHVRALGRFAAFGPGDRETTANVSRTLFHISRRAS